MPTRLSLLCDKFIEAGWLAAAIIVPLFFNLYSHRAFEPDKISLLRSITLLMSAAWLLRVMEDWLARRSQPGTEPAKDAKSFLQQVIKNPIVLATLLLAVAYIVSTIFSLFPRVSFFGSYRRLQGTYTLLSYLVIFFLMLQGLRTSEQLNRLITVMVLVSFPIAVYGIIQHFGLDPLPWGGNVSSRVASSMGNPIFLAAFLIMAVPLTLSRLLENWKETVSRFDERNAFWGIAAAVLPAGGLMLGLVFGGKEADFWWRWLGLLTGLGLQIPLYLFLPVRRQNGVLAISIPLTFAFLVGLSWTLELFFPPATAEYFWMGLMTWVVFVLFMAAFAAYLHRPISRFMALAAYFVILITQIVCIFCTQSRGPQLGLMAGLFFYFTVLGLIKRRLRVARLLGGSAIVLVIFLVFFNTADWPLMESLRNTPYVGRLGKLLRTEPTAKVRILIWEGVIHMMGRHPLLENLGEGDEHDRLMTLRPVIGYGPESMNWAYSRFYRPELARYEKPNSFPDRSHNETFDVLVTTGAFGLAVYLLLITSIFYCGLKWLGMITTRWQVRVFLGLWIIGGLAGGIGAWGWQGPPFLGVGILGGVMLGLGTYVLILMFPSGLASKERQTSGDSFSLWTLALVSAMVAHLVESHIGISIVATRTYFWVYAALMIVIGIRFALARKAPEQSETEIRDLYEEQNRSMKPPSQPCTLVRKGRDGLDSVLVLSVLGALILATLLFEFVTLQYGGNNWLSILWRSLTQTRTGFSPAMLVFVLVSWSTVGLVGLSDLAAREGSKGRSTWEWLLAASIFVLVISGGALSFALCHVTCLSFFKVTTANAGLYRIISYLAFVLLLVFVLALLLAFQFLRQTRSRLLSGEWWKTALVSLVVVLGTSIFVWTTNIRPILADILYKQAGALEKSKQRDSAIFLYEKAIDMSKDQDFYYTSLSRTYMEKGLANKGETRETWFQESENTLLKALEIAPFNVGHYLNLGRLYSTWGGVSRGQQRTILFNKAFEHCASASSLSPNNVTIYNQWGQILSAQGDLEQAGELYKKSLTLDPEYDQTHLHMADLYIKQKEWQMAERAYSRAAEIRPKGVKAYSGLGYVYTQMGDREAALQAYQKAVKARPGNFNDHKNLAVLYQRDGQVTEAIAEAERALLLAPPNRKEPLRRFLTQLKEDQENQR